MFLHKYEVGGEKVFRLHDGADKPPQATLKTADWVDRRRVTGKIDTGLKQIAAGFKEPPEVPIKQEEGKPEVKKALSLAEKIRAYAVSIMPKE